MNENRRDNQYYEDEIDLKELILALWKQKKMIISLTLVFAILAGIFSMFVLSPVYDTKLNVVINMPKTFNTKYSEYEVSVKENEVLPIKPIAEYVLPITTNDQYINLITSNNVLVNTIRDMGYNASDVSLEKLKKRITVGKYEAKADTIQNSFEVTVSADNPEESLKLAQTLYENYIEFLKVMTNESAVNYYYNAFSVRLKSLEVDLNSNKDILAKNEVLLAQTPETINQKDAMREIQGKMNNASDYVVLENIINENYTRIEKDIIINKQTISTIQDKINTYNNYIKELDAEKQAIAKYYETGKDTKLESSVINVVESSIYLPSQPVAPTKKTSPSNTMNVAIGIVVGGMIGVMAALIKEYWLKQA